MGKRRTARDQRQVDMKLSRRKNGVLKKKETTRRDTRMLGLIKANKLPYIPSIMSWLSQTLSKPSSRITQADVDSLTQG